jgi:predicted small lipoprotein YifL
MKNLLMSVLVILLAMSVAGCGRDSAVEQTEAQKKATAEFEKQFEASKKQAEKLLAATKEKAGADGDAAKEKVQHAVDSAEKLVGELKASGGKAWEEKKPVAEAAIKDLSTKISDAVTKAQVGDFKLPFPGRDKLATTQAATQKNR